MNLSEEKSTIIEDLEKIMQLIPEYIELIKNIDQAKNIEFFIIERVDINKIRRKIEYYLNK